MHEESLTELLEPVITAMGYELVGVEFQSGKRQSTVRLYIDAEGGVGLGDCEAVSHQVSGVLDVEDPIQGAYVLEVSSPGLDRPIFKASDYERFRGERIRLRLRELYDGRRRVRGLLGGLDGEYVVVTEADGGPLRVPLELIEKARLDLDP